MDPCAQDVLLCDVCKTDPLQSHCELCHISLCSNCVSKHLLDSSKDHNVRPYHLQRKSTPKYSKCSKHNEKDGELYCEQCNIPVCSTCALFGDHKGHKISDVLEILDSKKQRLQRVLEELETRIRPRYDVMACDAQAEKSALEKNCIKLTEAAEKQGEIWHREIAAIVNQRKFEITETKNKHLAVLNRHTNGIAQRIAGIKQAIVEIKNILDTNDISLTSTYKSRNDEFKKFPSKVKLTLPSLSVPKLDSEKLNEMFGLLSSLSITTASPLLDEPRLITSTDTGYIDALYTVRCLNEEQIWTRGKSKTMKLLNLRGELLSSIKTKSRNLPMDIAVKQNGDLVYTDPDDKSVNLVKNKEIQTVLRIQGWIPRRICFTSSGELLVLMISDNETQCKVIHYSAATKTQTIQFDDQDRPLYSSGGYITENKNLDICVADIDASAVVVVNQSGKLRFRYTGHPSNTEKSFDPTGITTDSKSHILIADRKNHRIHILNQNGRFLRYIHNCHLSYPNGLCVDSRDNLFVAERDTAKVKKIQYLKQS